MTTFSKNPDSSVSLPGIEAVGGFFHGVLALMEDWKPDLQALFSDAGSPPLRRELDRVVEPLVRSLLQQDSPLAGAGFVAAKDALADAQWHMAWWQENSRDQLIPSTMESLGEVYSRREWFTTPLRTGSSHVTGPYVDFLCTDEYTVTLTVPVTVGTRTVGVVGADVFVASLETVLLPPLRQLHPEAALVNRAGRIIVSADPQLPAGRLLVADWRTAEAQPAAPLEASLRGPELEGALAQVHNCPGLPLGVVIPGASAD